jgi:sarcosine oxidase subunit gamma
MSGPVLELQQGRARLGLKGPRAEEWLAANAVRVPAAPNTWTLVATTADAGADAAGALLVARLGTAEFFLEGAATVPALRRMTAVLEAGAAGVYPVLREDWCLQLRGEQVHEVLAQVCNVDFAALRLDAHPLIMTLMIGVAVLVVPQEAQRYRLWCDPTFGPYLSESLGAVVIECGGSHRGVRG